LEAERDGGGGHHHHDVGGEHGERLNLMSCALLSWSERMITDRPLADGNCVIPSLC
jgi:hypothetical protein